MFATTDCRTFNCYYEAIKVEVLESGCYKFVIYGTINTYGYISEDYFKPVIPTENLFLHIDRHHHRDQFELETSLLIDTVYILVASALSPNVTGLFSVLATGRSNITFTRISEYV